MADKIIYLDIPKYKRSIRILIRFIKQKLNMEKVNYKPTLKMLKNMYRWSKKDDKEKEKFEEMLNQYKNKLEIKRL